MNAGSDHEGGRPSFAKLTWTFLYAVALSFPERVTCSFLNGKVAPAGFASVYTQSKNAQNPLSLGHSNV